MRISIPGRSVTFAVAASVVVLMITADPGRAQCWACDFSTEGQFCGQHSLGSTHCAQLFEGGETECRAFGGSCVTELPIALRGDGPAVDLRSWTSSPTTRRLGSTSQRGDRGPGSCRAPDTNPLGLVRGRESAFQ